MYTALSAPIAADTLTLNYPVRDLIYTGSGVHGNITGLQVKETSAEIRFSLSGDVLFGFDKATIDKSSEGALLWLLDQIKSDYPGSPVRIEGHTDSKGLPDYNIELSRQRANAVARWLSSHGKGVVGKISTTGLGESSPVAPNEFKDGSDNPQGRKLNRRVEVIVEKR